MLETNDAEALLCSSTSRGLGFELSSLLVQELSPLMKVKEDHIGGGPILPVLEIFLISSASTIMTSILNKFGEDIYSHIKTKIAGLTKKQEPPLRMRITLISKDMTVTGFTIVDSYKSAIDAITNAKQMLIDVDKNQTVNIETYEHLRDSPLIYGVEYISIIKSGTIFEYEYDKEATRWKLKKIAKLKSI